MNLRAITYPAWFSILAACCAACASAGGARDEVVPATCADLSGTYQYPGYGGLATSCKHEWEGRFDMPLPGEGGFKRSASRPHPVTIRQFDCRRLEIETRVGVWMPDPRAGAERREILAIDLTPARGRQVRWGARSVFWRQKFIPAGMRFFFPRAFMELELTRLEDGSLEYFLRQEEHGRTVGQIRCRWPRVEGEAETAAPQPGR